MFTPDGRAGVPDPARQDRRDQGRRRAGRERDSSSSTGSRDVVPAGTEVLTGAQITAEDQAAIKEDMSFFNVFLLVFAVIALFVGSFIIYNSFSILVAQRTKEMALMRAIGASRKQVTRSVLLEAGSRRSDRLGARAGRRHRRRRRAEGTAVRASGIDIPAGGVVLTQQDGDRLGDRRPRRQHRLGSVPRPAGRQGAADRRDARRRRRSDRAAAAVGSSTARSSPDSVRPAMGAGLFGDAGIAPVGLGAVLVFVGVAVLGPVLARPISRVIGAPLPRLKGMSPARSPGRTRCATPSARRPPPRR